MGVSRRDGESLNGDDVGFFSHSLRLWGRIMGSVSPPWPGDSVNMGNED